jgi:metallo-beta-lactamase class B
MRRFFSFVVLLLSASAYAQINPEWTTPLAPFQIADNLYYVGSRDLAAYLITTPDGDILINANLVSSPPLIRASVEKLGFHWTDIKIVLNSQAHSDHVGGLAQILKETHAKDMVMEFDAEVVRSGGHDDFAFGTDITTDFPPAKVDRVLHDNDTVTLGDIHHGGVLLNAYKTAGHTRGCTTWVFQVHVPGEPAEKLRTVVIVGGFAALPGYRLVSVAGRSESYPGITSDFEDTFATLRKLPCDIFLGAHGLYFDMLPKLTRYPKEGPSVFIDPAGYKDAVEDARKDFNNRLTAQRAAAAKQDQ